MHLPMQSSDEAIRQAAFRFLDEAVSLSGDDGALPHAVLKRGFVYDGDRVPLIGPQGIFKP